MKEKSLRAKRDLPKNRNLPNDKHNDLIIRELDCSVIEYMHLKIEEEMNADIRANGFTSLTQFDTVRGIFTEGGPAFEGAGIQAKSHIQICIRNLNCIKGFFIPRHKN
jgi:hypothetical protein